MDALQFKIQALLDESRTMQASITQLTVQEERNAHSGIFSDHPVILGLEGLLLGAAVLCLGGLLGAGFAWRHLQAALAPHPADFGESIYSFRRTDEAQHPAIEELQESMSPQESPVMEPPRALPEEADVYPDIGPSSGLFATPESGTGFDVEAAASEVQRVRRSLADKRAARERWNASDPYPADAMPQSDGSPDLLPLDFDLTEESENIPAPEPLVQAPVIEDAFHVTSELEQVHELSTVTPTDSEGDQGLCVKLELAQEFLSLGLLDGARELAMEFMDSTEAGLHSQAMVLISQIDQQEQQERERALRAKIQAQHDLAAMFSSLPTQ
jgi:hypothetical protein